MAQAKKKATAKAVKPKSSDARNLPGAKSAHRSVAGSTVKAPAAGKQVKEKKRGKQSVDIPASKRGTTSQKAGSKAPKSRRPASGKAGINPGSATSSQKFPVDRGTNTRHSPKAGIVKEANEKTKVAKTSKDKKAAAKQQPVNKKAEDKISQSIISSASPERGKAKSTAGAAELEVSEIKAGSSKQSEYRAPSRAKGKKRDSEFTDSSGQAMEKSGQKKRGWRDIEALTERARLKSLLSDIWHEDIDLDSDIFGETDHLYGYYTDKEEVEIESEEDEEWEEFEEDED